MLLRTLVNLVNLSVLAVVIVLLLLYPQYAGEAFYLILGWVLGSLILIYGPLGNRPIGAAHAVSSSAPAAGSPFPSKPTPRPSAPGEIPFCIYCAAPLPPGAAQCPACGHRAVPV
jgi:hypothetical protein